MLCIWYALYPWLLWFVRNYGLRFVEFWNVNAFKILNVSLPGEKYVAMSGTEMYFNSCSGMKPLLNKPLFRMSPAYIFNQMLSVNFEIIYTALWCWEVESGRGWIQFAIIGAGRKYNSVIFLTVLLLIKYAELFGLVNAFQNGLFRASCFYSSNHTLSAYKIALPSLLLRTTQHPRCEKSQRYVIAISLLSVVTAA